MWLNGRELAPEDVYNIGYLPEERGLYKQMKVGEQAIYFRPAQGALEARSPPPRLRQWFQKFGHRVLGGTRR